MRGSPEGRSRRLCTRRANIAPVPRPLSDHGRDVLDLLRFVKGQLLLLGVVVFATSACTQQPDSRPEQGGPLYAGETTAILCVPKFKALGKLRHGSDFIENSGNDTLRVEDVSLVDAYSVNIVATYTRPANQGLIGTTTGWPQKQSGGLVPLVDLEPGIRRNLVLDLRADEGAEQASFAGVEVTYVVAAKSYVVQTPLAVRWKSSC